MLSLCRDVLMIIGALALTFMALDRADTPARNIPFVAADYERCPVVKNDPLPPHRRGKRINNGPEVVDII